VRYPPDDLRGIIEIELDAGIYIVEVETEFSRVVVAASALRPDLSAEELLIVPAEEQQS
jgi:hypothetical protein